ncbi:MULTISPECIES: TraR/DksA C4-type zinc finger protein [Pseudomonas]|uniref:TraR/DksA C4-type zinc finger protein n=1 Tax=Pseudomonas TaxID=286 RepID=UPI00093FFC65|nr:MULTISPECIES: TraR/DksA C4-type zinc finger protein [Pseudomonas]EIU1418049.1 TraR/DksA C4-type zinc finger protein [Pseudomonas aeruginosa]EKU3793872.1 TraR/DksA C4-type zinc finger protein [Pseudomonas aeruginosa]EKV3155501.1 TraR/DksA C4-type zinc finger protein [Pseudomonas aeruginosa]EKX0259897.1 TraR/DksA C4-type zinc finger protein [Pseudomonas aeruginosa]ELQ2786189.1 TraR/DksA C4-type zinc finger protein [Pseudomonas aeruginosa]
MDVVDRCTEQNDFTEAALEAHLSSHQRRSGPSAYRCDECGDAIPEARRQAEPGTQHCVECKQYLEHLQKRGPQWI